MSFSSVNIIIFVFLWSLEIHIHVPVIVMKMLHFYYFLVVENEHFCGVSFFVFFFLVRVVVVFRVCVVA